MTTQTGFMKFKYAARDGVVAASRAAQRGELPLSPFPVWGLVAAVRQAAEEAAGPSPAARADAAAIACQALWEGLKALGYDTRGPLALASQLA